MHSWPQCSLKEEALRKFVSMCCEHRLLEETQKRLFLSAYFISLCYLILSRDILILKMADIAEQLELCAHYHSQYPGQNA